MRRRWPFTSAPRNGRAIRGYRRSIRAWHAINWRGLDPSGDYVGLREAAALFRCCTALDSPRRVEAFFGMANALLYGLPGPQKVIIIALP